MAAGGNVIQIPTIVKSTLNPNNDINNGPIQEKTNADSKLSSSDHGGGNQPTPGQVG
jgi:hypothetical protein